MNGDIVKKIFKNTALIGVFLIPFIPFVITGSMFFPFITGKNFTFRVITEIIFAAWLILAIKDVKYRPKFSWIFVSIASFIGIVALADIFGVNALKSIWSNFERMEGLITIVHLFAYFVVASSVLNTEKLWNRFLKTSVGVSVVIGTYGIFQFFGYFVSSQSGYRLDATFGNASYLAVYMLFHVFITALLLLKHRGAKFVKWVYIAIIAFQAYVLLYTATRGAILGLFVGVLISAILVTLFEKESPVRRKIALIAVVTAVVLSGVFFLIKDSNFIKSDSSLNRVASISLEQGTHRFTIWGMAWKGVLERPMLGWGQENFNIVFNKYYEPSLYGQEQWFDRVHNIVFDWLIAAGFLGLLSYLSIFITALYYLWFREESPSRTEAAIITGLLVGYFFHNLFVFDNIVSYIFFFSILAYVNSSYASHIKERPTYLSKDDRSAFKEGTTNQIIVTLVIISLFFSFYYFNIRGILSAQSILKALVVHPEGPTKNLEFYQKALSYGFLGNQEAREQIIQGAIAVNKANVNLDLKQQFTTLGQVELQKQIDHSPNDARLQLFMGSFLGNLGRYQEAKPYLEEAVKLSPNKQTTLFEMGLNYLNNNDNDKALEIFKRAFELDPNFERSRTIYATILILYGDRQKADELLEEGFGTVLVDDERLLQAYFNTSQFDRVIGIWQKRVENNPNNAQYHVSLGAAYLAVENRNKAIEEIGRAIELNPSFKEQGEFFIREIRAGRNP